MRTNAMIDSDGYRPNVGIVVVRDDNHVLWAKRIHDNGWQFPQGGMNTDETPLEAMYRELREETGLRAEHVDVLGVTPGWLRYQLPHRYRRRHSKPLCIGQKQVWYLVRLNGDESLISLNDAGKSKAEFNDYRWVDYWYPAKHVIRFKRSVYTRALKHLEGFLNADPMITEK